jgi:hypothetical protein
MWCDEFRSVFYIVSKGQELLQLVNGSLLKVGITFQRPYLMSSATRQVGSPVGGTQRHIGRKPNFSNDAFP